MSFRRFLSKGVRLEANLEDYVNLLPSNAARTALESFPILNPLRGNRTKQNSQRAFEAELQIYSKREQILNEMNLNVAKFPSISKILNETMSQTSIEVLEKWKQKMIEKLGKEGFMELQKQTFAKGKTLHQCITHRLLQGEEPEMAAEDDMKELWQSLTHVFPKISDVKFIEKSVKHPYLCYKGIVDCVAFYENELVVIDWKTSSRLKPMISNLYDEPLQTVAYLGALNFDVNFDVDVERAVIVVAYNDGTPAQIHRLSHAACKHYWLQWLMRVRQYWNSVKDVGYNNLKSTKEL